MVNTIMNGTIYCNCLGNYLCHNLPVHVSLLDYVPESTWVLSEIQLQLQKRYNVLVVFFVGGALGKRVNHAVKLV
jgi:hypothetical protein